LRGVDFRRQHATGPNITDICTPGKKLSLEVNGGLSADQAEYDARRTSYLERKGYRMLRFNNSEVMKAVQRVLDVIAEYLE
jgi:very-short-patch-repair endonuclease